MDVRSRWTVVGAVTVRVATPTMVAPLTGATAVAVIVAVPPLTLVASPAELMVATVTSLEPQVTAGLVRFVSSTVVGDPLKFPIAVNWVGSPIADKP